jgi:hypothetical protein
MGFCFGAGLVNKEQTKQDLGSGWVLLLWGGKWLLLGRGNLFPTLSQYIVIIRIHLPHQKGAGCAGFAIENLDGLSIISSVIF